MMSASAVRANNAISRRQSTEAVRRYFSILTTTLLICVLGSCFTKSAGAQIILLDSRDAENVNIGEGFDSTLNAITKNLCLGDIKRFLNPEPQPATAYGVDGVQVLDQATKDKFEGVNLKASYHAAIGGGGAELHTSGTYHFSRDRRDYEFHAWIDTDQTALLPATSTHQYVPTRQDPKCGDRFISRIIRGYAAQIEYHLSIEDERDQQNVKAIADGYYGPGRGEGSDEVRQAVAHHNETSTLAFRGAGLPPKIDGFDVSKLSLSDFLRYITALQNHALEGHPGVVAIEVEPYDTPLSTSPEFKAAQLLKKLRQLQALEEELEYIKGHAQDYLWKRLDGSYLYNYVPAHAFEKADTEFDANALLSDVSEEESGVRFLMTDCEKKEYQDCTLPTNYVPYDYNLRIRMPVPKAGNASFQTLDWDIQDALRLNDLFDTRCSYGFPALDPKVRAQHCYNIGFHYANTAWYALTNDHMWNGRTLFESVGSLPENRFHNVPWPQPIPWPFAHESYEMNVVAVNNQRAGRYHDETDGWLPDYKLEALFVKGAGANH